MEELSTLRSGRFIIHCAVKGEHGERGDVGKKGDKGEIGDPGPQGEQARSDF